MQYSDFLSQKIKSKIDNGFTIRRRQTKMKCACGKELHGRDLDGMCSECHNNQNKE